VLHIASSQETRFLVAKRIAPHGFDFFHWMWQPQKKGRESLGLASSEGRGSLVKEKRGFGIAASQGMGFYEAKRREFGHFPFLHWMLWPQKKRTEFRGFASSQGRDSPERERRALLGIASLKEMGFLVAKRGAPRGFASCQDAEGQSL
jgi:hypothetical protein